MDTYKDTYMDTYKETYMDTYKETYIWTRIRRHVRDQPPSAHTNKDTYKKTCKDTYTDMYVCKDTYKAPVVRTQVRLRTHVRHHM